MYNGNSEVMEILNGEYGEEADNFLEITLKKQRRPAAGKKAPKVQPKDVCGSLKFYLWELSWKGLKRATPSTSRAAATMNLEYWAFQNLADQDEQTDLGDGEHGFAVLDVLDDEGHPFIEVQSDEGYDSCHGGGWSTMIAKRMDEDEWVGLSEAETDRLGMGLEYEQVQALAEGHDIRSGGEDDDEDEDGDEDGDGLVEVEDPSDGKRKAHSDAEENQQKKRRV